MPTTPTENSTPSFSTSIIPPNTFSTPKTNPSTPKGLASIQSQLKPNATFALRFNDPHSETFTAHHVELPNPYTASTSVNFIYVAQTNAGK